MSVINQVLKQLEQRGAESALDSVRAVPSARRQFSMPLLALGLALGLALAGGIVAWQWIQMHKPKVVAASGIPQTAQAMLPVSSVPAINVIPGVAPLTAALSPPMQPVIESGSIPQPATNRQGKDTTPDNKTRYTRPEPVERNRFPDGAAGETTPQTGNPHPIPPPEGEGSIALSPSGRKMDRGLGAVASLRDFNVMEHPVKTAARPSRQPPADKPGTDASTMKQVSPAQHADAEFRKAVALMQQGHIYDAMAGYEEALRLDASHDAARQALVALLLESKRNGDAERVLQEGLENKPEHTGFAMLLARLQVEHGAVETATATLNKSLPYADKQANYQAFLAALLQRQDKHEDAIIYYQIALRISPNNGIWLMGCGISLQAVQRVADARIAFNLALGTKDLNPELRAFVQQKLKEL